ncbi:polyphosphate kinase [Ilyomonas limi]|uniref:Polyphosphate kinase n=1 Tax=Ilyomonas limi TaxID=2575867 RepID=A0A4U3KWX4_9BACT|nr:PPK2 family polyphosphate kinase [Ilyomonas limi]TKK66920.1 polyphosphate kinase [Ilyomonas limi]
MAIQLSEISTRAPKDMDKEATKVKTASLIEQLDELQNLLYASAKYAVLVIIQGMDASGKDGAIKHVFGPLNPLGVSAKAFKAPTEEELSYDFLWRIHKYVPAKGMMQIFNRSQYEDVLVTRVHHWINNATAHRRMKEINHFESLLQESGSTIIVKFYLHISKKEQAERFEERLTDSRKHWKFNSNDAKEAELWDEYRKAYEDCFARCDNPPWIIVPADQNWYKEYVIASTMVEILSKLNLQYPALKEE